METAHMEHVLDHTKTDFMDTTNSYFDSIGPMDYLQYPHSPSFGVSMGRAYFTLLRPIDPLIEANTNHPQCPRRPPRASASTR